ncbi:hypothetical protein [Ileibacterium valens]|uniref:Cell division protein FtsL n=1 Tax=Ileibacterium valens TaxID=1862668 RepID=A0A1U7NGD2_9FIRM|nr:hypothetical protein [Ileibacterium valens]OLU37421.1 hypothetical protein BO224_10810 [Erysipelotrichaceae bacterium NYU-BL-E8]OLU38550.1 hypothetical protein BM735_09175 [Erysipelotrichaceae bacterium NYU-BL-F16]OLU40138.1 hypothetical protein BO222_05655 [Ileibacterium valens]
MKSKGKTVRKRTVLKKKRKDPMQRLLIVWLLFAGVFLSCRLLLNSYNASLSRTNTELVGEISKTEEEIDQLQSEVNVLQDKTSVLGMLDNQVSDNQNNIYVIDNK